MKIESTDQDIRTLLSSGYYRIPRFQRPYSWDRENIEEFWDDVIRDSPTDYFIGSMVVYKQGNQVYGVVDGQQRLTTITLLLCVLRNTLSKHGLSDYAQGIHSLIERKNIDNKPEYILTPETSYPFFQDHIQKFGSPDLKTVELEEEVNLKSAYEQLNGYIEKLITSIQDDTSISNPKRRIKNKLLKIRDSLLNLKLILIKLDNEDDAYLIFETLNTRGKDLSLTDLVKNHLTKHLKTRSASLDAAKLKWKDFIEVIQGASVDLDTDSFIHHFWLSKYNYIPQKKLFKVLKKEITKKKAKQFLNDLLTDSKYYRSIFETSYGDWSKHEERLVSSLNTISLFRLKQPVPCILSLVRAYKDKKIKKKHIEDALVAIEKFHFIFTAVTSQRSSGGISSMYASLARRIYEAQDTDETVRIIRDLKDKLRKRVPSKSEFIAVFPSIIYTNQFTKQRKLVRYILTEIAKSNVKNIAIDYDKMTIEHLVSQSEIDKDDFNHEIIGQLGNLLLVPEELNGKLKNKKVDRKLTILKKENYNLFPEIFEFKGDWTPSKIEERTQLLGDLAYNKIWRI